MTIFKQKKMLILVCFVLVLICGCYTNKNNPGIGAVGWDDPNSVEGAKNYPTTRSERVTVTTSETPYGTFHQGFDTVFNDFPFKGTPVMDAKTSVAGTDYSVSYDKFILKIFRGDSVIAEKKLPQIFYMHAMNSGVIKGASGGDDIILCKIFSRSTTGLSYVGIFDGTGEILYETVMSVGDVWDILPGKDGEIVIGGARSKTLITIGSKK
jgi:hypothetical protein